MFTACHDDPVVNVTDAMLYGKWMVDGTTEYWRYDDDHTGVTWDVSEISEEASNLKFEWELHDAELLHVFAGEMGNQGVSKAYRITQIGVNTMSWEDDYGVQSSLHRVK